MKSFPAEAGGFNQKGDYKVFKGLAKHSKSSMGYFYGFKLHVIINS
ncbi:transposase [Candidatus Tisiphia endosymbiont of Parasteatoda lunata]